MSVVWLVIFAVGVVVGLAIRRGGESAQSANVKQHEDLMEHELSQLHERISVLERIQTDADYRLNKKFSGLQ